MKDFVFKPFSKKQRQVLNWWCENSPVKDKDGIIADGAIRSGKSLSMSLSFILWSMTQFSSESFAMCGKTIESFRRNVFLTLEKLLLMRGFKITEKRSQNLITISKGKVSNNYYIFGGRDESSQDLIQGMTLAGIFFDEVVLMPESFVNQAVARCSVSGSKFWFNCNPSDPTHWFYRDWIEKRSQNGKNLIYLHFKMDDNNSLSEKIKNRYKNMYSGVFHKRYVEGLWVAADGAVYAEFANDKSKYCFDTLPKDVAFAAIGLDFGGNNSAHAAVCVGFSKGLEKIYALSEFYSKDKLSPSLLEDKICDFIMSCQKNFPNVTDLYCDSAEQVLIRGIKEKIRKRRININVRNAKKCRITERIRFTNAMLSSGRMFVNRECMKLIDALSTAIWDKNSTTKDVRLDNGSVNIDSLDAFEYAFEKYIDKIV